MIAIATPTVLEHLHAETTIAEGIFHLAEATGIAQPIAAPVSIIIFILLKGYKSPRDIIIKRYAFELLFILYK